MAMCTHGYVARRGQGFFNRGSTIHGAEEVLNTVALADYLARNGERAMGCS